MKQSTDASPIAFRIGQIDALAKTLLASPALYSPEMRASLALRWLSRAWQQDRHPADGERGHRGRNDRRSKHR